METVHVRLRDGEIDDAGSWLYAWIPAASKKVVYVGGTGLPPAVRTWLHLHHEDPSVARMAHRYPKAQAEPVDVIAFRLPETTDRGEAKAELIRQLDSLDLLSSDYVGDEPAGSGTSDQLREMVAAIASHLQDVTS